MTLGQAFVALSQSSQISPLDRVFLICGFQPLHLPTFLRARFSKQCPGRAVSVQTGLYNDLFGTLSAAVQSDAQGAAVVIEWSDLDPRLGLRSSGGWGPSVEQDILTNCRERFAHVLDQLQTLASRMPVALAGPTLRPSLFGHTAGWHFSTAEAALEQQVTAFLADASCLANVSVVHPGHLARVSPEHSRLDPKMEVGAGFPYSLPHASALAGHLIKLLYPVQPMKGLITDLDDTLWSGLVGEVGAGAVSWGLAEHSQIHGLYQQELRTLAEMGVLLAIASKNEPAVVETALQRADLHVQPESFFPVCVSWNAKSGVVAEILRTWNIGPESVVFVDDSAMELDEVRNAFPAITCIQFPKDHLAKAVEMLEQLRDLFGKPLVQREDTLRLASIRANAVLAETAGQSAPGQFLKQLQGRVIFDASKDRTNKRLLELINKTNQFNLNGVRITQGEWLRFLDDDGFVIGVSYEDKFGPLGTISVVAGKHDADRLDVSAWVLSCRAFSRKIEFHTLEYLFRWSGARSIALSFQPTERNQPLQAFLKELGLTADRASRLVLSREEFLRMNHDLPHGFEMLEGAVNQLA
jgi:FkbH-like protein